MNIGNIANRILTMVVGVAGDAHVKEPMLQPLRHVIMTGQNAIYWLRLTTEEPEASNIIEEGGAEPATAIYPPTLLSVSDHLQFIDKELRGLINETSLLTSMGYSETTTYYLQRAFDKLHEALFNTELAINYYEQLTRARG